MNNTVGYRNIAINGRYIRGYGLPNYASKATGANSNASTTTENTSTSKPQTPSFKLGDSVKFTGGGVYVSSVALNPSATRGESVCKLTQIANGKAHPYHLISSDDKKVYGWVNAENVVL